jgi:hypothetical protein
MIETTDSLVSGQSYFSAETGLYDEWNGKMIMNNE